MEKTIKFWSRTVRNGMEHWQLVECRDASGVPAICWRKYNAAFWKRHLNGSLQPVDELACYQAGCAAMIRAVRKRNLHSAARSTYITAAGLMRMRQFVREEVAPCRASHIALLKYCREADAQDVQAYVESLPAHTPHAAAIAKYLTHVCIEETLALCSMETQYALRAYLLCDLSVTESTYALGMSRQTFVWKRDHRWFPEFRRNCTWRW